MSVKDSLSKAITKYLTYFANSIENRMYNKSQTDTKMSTLNANITNNYIKKTDLEKKVNNRYNVNTENIIFKSVAASEGEYTLLDSIENYTHLIVYMNSFYNNSTLRAFNTSIIISVKDNVYYTTSLYPQYRIHASNGNGYYIDFSFKNNNTLKIHSIVSSSTNYELRIYKIQGIKI